MIAMLDTSEDLLVCREQLGCPVEQLLTPLTRFKRQNPRAKFAIDNGAFKRFRQGEFKALLLREKDAQSLCRFVAVPDIFDPKAGRGSARRTLEVFNHWKYKAPLVGWPLALVIQDGIEDLPIPWTQIKAVFIGGSTEFKFSGAARDVIRAAKAIGLWVHAGRVNTPDRFDYFADLDADSFDGTGIAMYSHMREAICEGLHQPNLLTGLAPNVDESSVQADIATAAIAPEITVESTSVAEG